MTPVLEILEPGLLTTVQDAGRAGLGHLGVPRSGACDPWSLSVANLLVGNQPGAAALELTLAGPTIRVLRACVVGLAGADLGAAIRGGRALASDRSHRLAPGEILSFAGPTHPGSRAYLALAGGIDVPPVLGSRSTLLAAGFGGLDGRALRPGDRLGSVRDPEDAPDGSAWIADGDPGEGDEPAVRVLPGPDASVLGDVAATTWTVGGASDRMGLRLEGPPLAGAGSVGERRPHGVVPGTIQLPPDGHPIILLADAQPTGGYPVPAIAISADLPVLGQLRPGAILRLRVVDMSTASAARAERAARLERGRERLAQVSGWDDMWRWADG